MNYMHVKFKSGELAIARFTYEKYIHIKIYKECKQLLCLYLSGYVSIETQYQK